MLNDTKLKQQISSSFGKHSEHYDLHAMLQQKSQAFLEYILAQLAKEVPPGLILEIGCGTGGLSQQLLRLFPNHPLELTDISPDMLRCCKERLAPLVTPAQQIHWRCLDGEDVCIKDRDGYALIVSSMTFQWFLHFKASVMNLFNCLSPGGVLCFSFLENASFPEWDALCRKHGFPLTRNRLPGVEEVKEALNYSGGSVETHLHDVLLTYDSARVFFQHLKGTGAAVSMGKHKIAPTMLRRMMQTWDRQSPGNIQITHKICLAVIQKNA